MPRGEGVHDRKPGQRGGAGRARRRRRRAISPTGARQEGQQRDAGQRDQRPVRQVDAPQLLARPLQPAGGARPRRAASHRSKMSMKSRISGDGERHDGEVEAHERLQLGGRRRRARRLAWPRTTRPAPGSFRVVSVARSKPMRTPTSDHADGGRDAARCTSMRPSGYHSRLSPGAWSPAATGAASRATQKIGAANSSRKIAAATVDSDGEDRQRSGDRRRWRRRPCPSRGRPGRWAGR